ncbi:PREDICTED: glucan endo-1,3-beta-glucosidase 12-like [Camelina sativa]|uniref:glucan endo-1,3-beta-D-glucosidase n=1 Tax=Camelina sativa TaxID=90675 RepID=A0ABM0XDX6_CAMSA|nr:PREDICTED: glucan endo-1,3-beta-glucosidase 12-like [Camelina sativa]
MGRLLYIVFFIAFLGFAGAGQESTPIEALNLHHKVLQLPQTTDLDLAVSVSDNKTITEISSSIIKAETWLKTHVLSRYPTIKITTIVVIFPDSCHQTTQHKPSFDLALTSLKNIYHSLTRWGLEKKIKVSSGFSYQCLENPKSSEMFNPVLIFLKTINSTFTINPPLNFLSSPDNHLDLLHSVEKLGSLSFNKVNFLNPEPEEATTRRNLRSLINISSKFTISFPTLPSPSPEHSPIHSTIGSSSPPTVSYFPEPPQYPPEQSPISSPPLPNQGQGNQGISLPPPCLPTHPAPSPSPVKKKDVEGLWCVAKPSVAAETLQQSLDFACGQGGANCDEIKPHGICYYPDTVMAHASYAFNSYWQKTKRNGGTCSFGGTAMLITTDPSYQHCRFILS